MKSLLQKLEEGRLERGGEMGQCPRVTLRVKPNERRGGSHYLVSVGDDYVELSNGPRGENSFLLDRKVIVEAFFG